MTGKVTSTEDGSTIPGVNVVVKGTTNGTTTDADGNYRLSVPASGTVLVFSFIGLTTEEVSIGERTVVDMPMTADVTQLSEVVVVGYGTQSKRDLAGSISSVQGKDIASMPVQSFEQALGGRATGVSINVPNGVMNNPPVIRIRGVSSVSLSAFPLIVIDGIPAFTGDNSGNSAPNNPLANINPADIESVEVLKDASASAIYGSRAANGVILITTKKGTQGKVKVTLDSWVGGTQAFRLFDVLNAQQYMDYKNVAVANLYANVQANNATLPPAQQQGLPNLGAFKPSFGPDGEMIDTDWYKHAYRTGFSHSNTIGISGASDKTSYYMSVGYTAQEGMLKKNSFDRTSLRLNLDHKVTKTLTFGTNFSYSNTMNSAPNSGSLAGSAFNTSGIGRLPIVLPPNVPAYNNDGTYALTGNSLGVGANINPTSLTQAPLSTGGYPNPVVILDKNTFTSESAAIQGAVYANWEIIKGLNARTMFGINNTNFEDISFATGLTGDGFTPNGSATNLYRVNKRWNWQNTLQYDKTFDKHSFSVLVGQEQQYTKTTRWGANRTTVADPFFETFQGNFTNIAVSGSLQGENYLLSYFGRLNYDFNKKYFFSFNARRDGYSAWGDEKWGTFYGGAVAYALSEEAFWKDSFLNKVSYFKVKASYGEVGNSQGIGDFASLQNYNSGLYAANATLAYSQAGNPALTWETSKKTDIGFMYGILNDRIQGEFSYYHTNVDGLILNVQQAPSKGIPNTNGTIPVNVGAMTNSGIELSVKFNAINTPNFKWTTSVNFSTLKNVVTKLYDPDVKIPDATLGLEQVNFTIQGQSIGTLIAIPSVGIDPANGRRMFQKADGTIVEHNFGSIVPSAWTKLDGTTTTAPSQAVDGVMYGPVLPTYFGGWDNNFSYKGIDLGVFFQFSGGNYIYNGTKAGLHDQRFWNNDVDVLDYWTPENPNAKWPRPVYGDNVSNGSALVISNNVEKGDFIRLRNVMLGYTFPKTLIDKVKLSNLRVYAQVQNAALITKYSGIDPENQANGNAPGGAGVDRNSVGQARTYTVGLTLGF